MLFHFANLSLWFIILIYVKTTCAFDDENDISIDHHLESSTQNHHPLPKDKILLRDVKTLTFQRNKRTTAKRTHSIPQLSCVGGTAGCKLFTPNVVECENVGFDSDTVKYNWRCHAEMSDRVTFNHVEVICEGYDYPEDDYILLGSCGLEFTLDYTNPADYHHNSYFHHMDEHEKELHREKVQAKQGAQKQVDTSGLLQQFGNILTGNLMTFGLFAVLGVIFVLLLITRLYFSKRRQVGHRVAGKRPGGSTGYGPLTSAVLTTKKAC